MKKISILVLTILFLAGMSAFAADVTYSGQFQTEFQNGFGEVPGDQVSQLDTRLQINVQVDEYNKGVVRLMFGNGADNLSSVRVIDVPGSDLFTGGSELVGNGAPAVLFDRAYIESDLLGSFGVMAPVGVTLNIGFNEFTYSNIASVTNYGDEGITLGDFTDLGSMVKVSIMDMVTVYGTFGLTSEDLSSFNNSLAGAEASFTAGPGTLGIEAVYSSVDEDGVGGGLSYAMPAGPVNLTITGAMDYYLGNNYTNEYDYSAAVMADYNSMVNGSISFLGNNNDSASAMEVSVGATPLPLLSIDLGGYLDLSDAAADTFNSMDASVQVMAGAAAFRLGYLWLADDNVKAGSTMFANTETSGIYVDATLEF